MKRTTPAVLAGLQLLTSNLLRAQENDRTRRLCKIFGRTHAWDRDAGIRVLNDAFNSVVGTDLGPMTLYRNKLWFNLGDTHLVDNPFHPDKEQNFLIACTTDAFLHDNGRRMFFTATTWEPYSIYLYEARFGRTTTRPD